MLSMWLVQHLSTPASTHVRDVSGLQVYIFDVLAESCGAAPRDWQAVGNSGFGICRGLSERWFGDDRSLDDKILWGAWGERPQR